MKNRILLFATLLTITLCASAQSMSDDQVLRYVMAETQKGTSQQEMAKELIQKGVSMQQLQRVKRKAEAMKMERGKTTERAIKGRTRSSILGQTKEDEEQDKMKTNDRGLYYTDPNDSLEYFIELEKQGQRKVFGRNIFNQENLTFQPASNMATPENYRLGGGDEVHIDIWGASQMSITETISPDGIVVIEGVGPINLGGKTVAQAKNTLRARLSEFYSDCQFNLSVGETRTIQVQVVGEVNTPGTYALNSLCSAFNALYAAGGISEIGTLRDIKVFRAGKQIATIDVYEYLIHGATSGDVRLQDNDLIVVGPYDCLVQIDGKVKRPMWYEMKKSETVRNLLQYAGNFTGDAYTQKVRVIRKSGQEYSVHTVGEFEMGNFNLTDEDIVQVDSVRARYSNMIEIRGAVVHAGKFQLGGDIQSVRGLVQACDGLREDAYVERAIMHREKEDLTLEMISLDLKGIMDGTSSDIPLKKNDVLFIPSKTEMLGDRTLSIYGEIFYPGKYPYADNTTLQDFIIQAGGFKDGASLSKVDVLRRVRDAKATTINGTITENFTFSLDEHYNIVGDTTDFFLKPYDEVIIYKSPAYNEQKTVRVRGEANFTGVHALTKADYRLSDLIKACGGFTEYAYIAGASLIRTMTREEIDKRNEANNRAQVALYESIIKEGKDVNMALADSLLSMRRNTENTYPVAIELNKAIANPGSNYDLVLREGDVITIPEFNNTVKVNGEVMSPVSMPYEEGKNLYYYIRHAGGYSHNAARSRVYGIRMNGSVVKLSSNSVHDIQPGTEIYVPAKKATKGMSTPEIMAMTSSGASLASVIVALMNIIKK